MDAVDIHGIPHKFHAYADREINIFIIFRSEQQDCRLINGLH
jgi:hypothetical protein